MSYAIKLGIARLTNEIRIGSQLSTLEPVELVFILENTFNRKYAPDGKKYAIAKPVDIGISGENYYYVKSGIEIGQTIVTGGYRVLSKELQHGSLVLIKDNLSYKNTSSTN